MSTSSESIRRAEIVDAAYAVLRERGYRRTSLLLVAKAASASNQTMYRWFGSKEGLFAELVRVNAESAHTQLVTALEGDDDPIMALRALAPTLLRVVLGDRAIHLNRAAAADEAESSTLGRAIAENGRELILPLLVELIRRAHAERVIDAPDPTSAAECYVALLIGDLQIRRAIGAIAELTDEEASGRSRSAVDSFLRLYPLPG